MKGVFRVVEFLAAATAVLLAVVVIVGYFQVGVPILEIKEHCDPSWPSEDSTTDEIIDETAERIWSFYENVDSFAIENDGRIVYLDIEIEASDSALGCALSEGVFGEFIGDTTADPRFWMNFEDDPWSSDFVFALRGPYGGVWQLSVPINQRALPKNGQYRAIDHNHILSVEGPFLIEHSESNGFGQVTLYPQDDRVLSESEISCSKFRLASPEWLREIVPCF